MNLYQYVYNDPINFKDITGYRPMTPGEIELAKKIFGSSVDYTKVDIQCTKGDRAYVIWNTIYAPGGKIDDPTLIHELVHVWQHQDGQWELTRGALIQTWAWISDKLGFGYNPYAYSSRDQFGSMGLEQQAQWVQDKYERDYGGK